MKSLEPQTPLAWVPAEGDEPFYEIVNGERVAIPGMWAYAAITASRLLFELHAASQQSEQGEAVIEMLFQLRSDCNRRPDVAFVSRQRCPKNRPYDKDADAWDVVPDLVVEMVNPLTRADELMVRLDDYFCAGVRLAWVMYPKQPLVYVYESVTQVRGLTRADMLDGGAVLPDFRLPLSELFPEA